MSGMPRRINDYPTVFAGWHGFSSLGHGLVLLSLFFFAAVVIEAKYTAERLSPAERCVTGVPYVSNRLAAYLLVLLQLRQSTSKHYLSYHKLNLTPKI